LDLIDVINEEQQLNEFQAFSPKDGPEKTRLGKAARWDAAGIFGIRRKLVLHGLAEKRVCSNKHSLNTYTDTWIDTCFKPSHTEPTRAALYGRIPQPLEDEGSQGPPPS
jgi:hypothetical protein